MENDKIDYALMASQVAAMGDGETHWLPVLANVSALVYETLNDVNWAGFYVSDAFLGQSEKPTQLVLGPFQGKVACVHIPWGKGVCGTAAQAKRSQLVPDVHAFAGHIACDAASRSELVVPIRLHGEIAGVLDLDSPLPARFTPDDQAGLELVVAALERQLLSMRP